MSGQTKCENEDGLILVGISWISKAEGSHISNVIKTYEGCDLKQVTAVLKQHEPVQLEQQGDVPCVVTLQCAAADPRSVITWLLVVSEARTIEVYSASGDYCGTSRGEEDPRLSASGSGRPFYQKYLKLQCPTTSCEVKLLSLGGHASVDIAGIHVGVERALGPSEEGEKDVVDGLGGVGASIDLKQVQSMVAEMGATLSPGAQHLMDMVQFQQRSRADAMAGFLPLLMGCGGGALSGLATNKGSSVFVPNVPTAGHQAPASPSLSAVTHTQAPSSPRATATPPPTPVPLPGCAAGPAPANSNNKLAEVMSALMMHASSSSSSSLPGQHCAASASPLSSSSDLLPFLQSVCCQVARLRMDDATAAAAAHSKGHMPNGPPEVHQCCRGLEEALGRRLQEMEERLREHLDQRLSSLEQKLDAVLQQVHLTPT
ncbi:ATPase PAAT [Engraulis encrasicolus]|uniref:ATPase PAAT n=1 Tax=Engraulis encrasicolus TaxID=184585 RepID=UPI002FCEBB35